MFVPPPKQTQRHLAKLFDNMASLEFEKDDDDQDTKTALGMYSKEGEYVVFQDPCVCEGQVEVWLNKIMDSMRGTVKNNFAEAVVSYEEKPREQWLFDYQAQVALAATQIWWTTEVGISFARLEEGHENALKDYNKKQV